MAKNENDRIIDTPETASAGRASYYSSGSTSSSSTVADHTHTTALNQGGSSLPLYLTLTGGTLTGTLTLPNTGLHILDTDASHDLIIAPGSDLTADRTLTITTGDADRTLTLTGAASIEGTNTGDQTNISGNAATVTVTDAGADATTWPLLGTSATGSLAPATDDTLTYDASTGALSATTFIGALTGTASGNLVSGGALGTPSSGTLTNATDLPISTGVSGLGSGVATFLATPSSANLAAAVTGETGTGALVFGTSPAFTTGISTPAINTASGNLTITPAAGSGVNVSLSTTGDFAVNTDDLFLDTSSGYLGLGTLTPDVNLQVLGTAGDLVGIGDDTLTSPYIYFGTGSSRGSIYTRSNHPLSFGTNNSPTQLYIDTNGDVGIGTTDPRSNLDIQADTISSYLSSSAEAASVTVWSPYTPASSVATGSILFARDDGTRAYSGLVGIQTGGNRAQVGMAVVVHSSSTFNADNIEAVRFDHGGNVGINATSPAAKLHIDQSSTTGAIPVLLLDQADTSEEFIEFTGTVGTGNSIDTAAVGTYYGRIRVTVTGVGYKYIPLYDA